MDAWIVWVASPASRWIDSVFVSKSASEERVAQVMVSMKSSGRRVSVDEHWAWNMKTRIEDAAVVERLRDGPSQRDGGVAVTEKLSVKKRLA